MTVLNVLSVVHCDALLQHVSKPPEVLQRGGLSGGATSADSKKIYLIDVSNKTSDSLMYAIFLMMCFILCHFSCRFSFQKMNFINLLCLSTENIIHGHKSAEIMCCKNGYFECSI